MVDTVLSPQDDGETVLGRVQPVPAPRANAEPPDYTEKYNTKLSAGEEAKFLEALKQNPKLARDLADYDVRGWWKSGGATAENGHGTDEFKKPNHPTFSDESKYHGADGFKGGKWLEKDGKFSFEASPDNLKNLGQAGLAKYFKQVEPDVELIYPTVGR